MLEMVPIWTLPSKRGARSTWHLHHRIGLLLLLHRTNAFVNSVRIALFFAMMIGLKNVLQWINSFSSTVPSSLTQRQVLASASSLHHWLRAWSRESLLLLFLFLKSSLFLTAALASGSATDCVIANLDVFCSWFPAEAQKVVPLTLFSTS